VGARSALLLALCGQLAMLLHGALVAHVTCGADGELMHVRAGVAAPAPAGTAAHAAVDGADDEHDHCLLDEEGEAACPSTVVVSGEPLPPTRPLSVAGRRARTARPPAPLYRLAPKNSPPA
jgi:hypothetical protein